MKLPFFLTFLLDLLYFLYYLQNNPSVALFLLALTGKVYGRNPQCDTNVFPTASFPPDAHNNVLTNDIYITFILCFSFHDFKHALPLLVFNVITYNLCSV